MLALRHNYRIRRFRNIFMGNLLIALIFLEINADL